MDTVSLRTRRIGGGIGIVAALAMIPAYLVGSPEAPTSSETAAAYYEQAEFFITANGWLPLLHVLGVLLWLGVVAAVLRSAAPASLAMRAAAIGGGLFWIALTAGGFAAEVVYPATALRFQGEELGADLPLITLTLATWLYHFSQIGAAVLMIGVAVLSYTSNAFPRWFAYLTVPFIVVALLHTWIFWWSGVIGLVWFGLVSLLLLFARPQAAPAVA